MTLYKFCDLYALLSEYDKSDFICLCERIQTMKMNDVCFYALFITRELFGEQSKLLDTCINMLKDRSDAILSSVVHPSEKKKYRYTTKYMRKRFFSNNRVDLLEEVSEDA